MPPPSTLSSPPFSNIAAEYKTLGTFRALDTRNVQTFEIHEEMAAKFLKLEIRSHYGNEHFCPLSVFRVYGTNAEEPDEYELVSIDEQEDEAEG